MPAWMHVTRSGPPPPPPPPPRDESVDPDYEVIDFGNNGQIYSNAPLPVGNNKSGKRCDLCGSSAPAVRCVQCTQNFCLSCDHMYHRHPKRQAHTRKELQDKVRPPLPPKGESAPAPVPPPRRNKTSGRPPPARPAAPPLQRNQEVKSPALLNSLARTLPSRPLADPPFPPMQNGVRPTPLQPERPSPLDMHKHHGNVGMSEWDVHRKSRAGSFSNLAAPGFSPLIQAQSMAQLNSPCPSCHFHGQTPPPMNPWGNNDPWGNWGPMPPWQSQNFLNHPPGRRSSRRGSMRHRRETSSGSEEEDDRMSRRGGGRRRKVSPTPSRRSRAPPSDCDSDEDRDDVGWEPRRGLSRKASLIDVNRSHRRDEDTMSLTGRRFSHATMSRAQREKRYEEEPIKNRRNTIDKIPYAEDERINSRSSGQRVSDADDSPRGHENNSLRRTSSRRSEARSERFSNSGRRKHSPARSLYNDNPSDSLDDDSSQKNLKPQTAEVETFVETPQDDAEPVTEPESEWDPVPDFDWECAHCTFVNSPGTRVCCICCKTNTKPRKHIEAPVAKMIEQMKSSTLERTGSRRIQQKPRQQDINQERLYQKQDSYQDRQMQQDSYKDRQRQQDSYLDQQKQDSNENRQRQQDPYQDRPQRWESFDRVQDKPYQNKDSCQDRARQQDGLDRVQDKSYQKQDSQSDRQQRKQDYPQVRSFQKQEYPDRLQRQQDFNGRTSDQERYQERVRIPEKSARGTSPMTTKRVEPNRSLDARSPDARTPDTKTSDSSSYSSRNVMSTSKGTSPPPQSISTQTYEVPQTKLKRATSLADYSEWRAPQRTYSRQSLLSDTQSLPVTPPKGRSPERFPEVPVVDSRRESEPHQARRRAGSQPPEYISTLVQKQVKQGLEMVKLLREAEEQKFSADDLAVALLHCEDGDPVAWLQQNWRNMIDTVVTLATNYGHERKENTVGTISASEARDALRIHDGNVWAAVTECVEQRQKKYAELLSRGNFSREDIVTVLTANHGNLEAASTELSKSQLKPFLMKIWGPPQGVDNESGNITKLAHGEAKGTGRGGIEKEEVSFNNFNRDRVQTWIDSSVPKSKLSQSMLHLNLIGKNKTLEKLEALSNLTKDEKDDLRARRTSDVHRYLTQFYALNENSLKISKSFANIHDVNKPQKENTNPLWKFLEKNVGLNSFASSGLLTTVSTTSSNVHVKSVTDFDSDSLNEGRSGGSEKSEGDGKLDDEKHVHDSTEVVQVEIEEPNDAEDITETGDLPTAGDNIAEQQLQLQQQQQQQSNDMEIHATSPIRQIFVKSISISTEGSRSVSPSKTKSPEKNVGDEESDDSSGSWESVDEESEDEKEEVDVNLAENNETKDVAVLGKLILKEEDMPIEAVQQKPLTDIETPVGAATTAAEKAQEEGSDEESEEEIMHMVETLLQKTEFLQEEPPAGTQKSINVMYTNKDSTNSSETPQSGQRNADQQVNDSIIDPNEDIEKEKEEFEEFDEAVTDQLLPGSEEPKLVDMDNSQQDVNTKENAGVEIASYHTEKMEKLPDPQGNSAIEIEQNEKETPNNAPNDTKIMAEHGRPENPPEEGTQNVQEQSSWQGVVENPNMVQGQTTPSGQAVKTQDVKNKIIAADENQADHDEDSPEDDNPDEIFEEPPEIVDSQPGLVDTLIEIGQTLANIVAATPSEGQPALGEVGEPVAAATLPTPDDGKLEQTKEHAVPAAQLATAQAEEYSLKVPEATQGSSSGTPQTALNMMETDSKSLATNLLQNSEGNSERDVSPIPTDSEKDAEFKLIKERQRLSRATSSYELSMGDKLFEDENKLQRTTSSHELVTLLKESLAKDDVVERIVSTLFQSVLRANDFGRPGRSSSVHISRHDSSLSRDMSYMGSSPSEIDDSEFFYEAVEPREPIPERRSRRNFRKRVRNTRKRGTPRRLEDSSVKSTSTENYSNRDEHSSSAAEMPEDMTETEREARRLLAEGIVPTYEKAELVVQLRALNFKEEECILAARECSTVDAAVTFLQQECDLCAGKYSMKQMVSMLECEHLCCKECAQNYFTLQITERSVNDCVCPFCKEPDLPKLDEDTASDYFVHLDIFLKALVSENTHELFHRKLRDRTLMSDPNFKWCIKCSSGFIANPKQRKLVCPDCRTITCANCQRLWEREHEKMTCEEFAAFKKEPEQDNQVEKHLAEGGVTCPKCHQRYLLAKGGCMHLTCPHCKHEFCSGCAKPFLMGTKCKVSANCERLGLHSHHPRNCLFYLRDKDPPVLEQILQEHGVELNKVDEPSTSKCKTQLLKETTEGLIEAICGHPVEGAGLCRTHYIEHLVDLLKSNKIDPVGVMDATDAVQELRRHSKELPTRADYATDKEFLKVCVKIISEEIPLE